MPQADLSKKEAYSDIRFRKMVLIEGTSCWGHDFEVSDVGIWFDACVGH